MHLDYYPMVNSRVHLMSDSAASWSLNKNFKITYEKFLTAMIEKKQLSTCDKLIMTYYL